MKTKTSSLIFVFIFFVLSVQISGNKLTDDVCNFLYDDNCDRCTNRDRPFHSWCGTYCEDSDSVDSGYSCSATGSCKGDQKVECPDPTNCDDYSGGGMCRVCVDHGCRWTNSEEGKCDAVEGGVTMASGCEDIAMTTEQCSAAYHTFVECTDDGECAWKWTKGSIGPSCFYKQDSFVDTNYYLKDSKEGEKLCELRENCDECHGADCTWCHDPDFNIGYCVYSNVTIDSNECMYEVNPPWETCPLSDDTPLSDCSDYTNCKDCTGASCSWCAMNGEADNGNCQEISKHCTSPDQDIEDGQYCPSGWEDECQKYTSCTTCDAQLNCGWCETDSLLHTGQCFYKSPTASVDECTEIESGEWKTECTDPSSCLEATDCDTCECTWCYLGEELSQCMPEDDCTAKQGIAIDECNKDNLNTYNCESKSSCESCFTEYPWCQWRYTGDWYQTQKCVFWSESKENIHVLDASDCGTFVACQNRTKCSDCVETSNDVLNCIWCKEGGKEYCNEYSEDQDDDNCSKICDESDDDSSSPGDVIKFNFFCWFISIFMLLFYLTETKLQN
ncbi:hypothetical protein M0812_07325 [Anaeramoeba flamelloides]|uniref:PSI domain-containing protein n=1 Tax=Anaeramoeba flamelloides TaxID=1746091 RepID=A0AAV8A3H5_9EUKA|nr:hypothetical protein M0812_07325 [Anaeramoeba flamelloides]